MKYIAKWNDNILAEADKSQILKIEGNVYFHPDTIKKDYFDQTDFRTTCHWKGEAYYYDIVLEDKVNKNAAWYYPSPKDGAPEKVSNENKGKFEGDFTNFVAFWKGVEVESVED